MKNILKNTKLGVSLITIIGLFLRLININQSLWLDEASQTTLSLKPLSFIWFGRGGDVHPPLAYILFHFWESVGTNDIFIRVLPVIFGVVTIPLVYLLVRRTVNEKVAILSSLFLAVAPYHIYYSQEVRMYSMATFFAVLSVYSLVLVLSKKDLLPKILFIFSSAALIYSHYVGGFLLAAELIYVLYAQRDKFKEIFLLLVGVFILYIPWIPQLLLQLKNGINPDQYLPGWSGVYSLSFIKIIPLTFIKFAIGRIDFSNHILYGLIVLLVGVMLTPLLYLGVRKLDRKTSLFLFWLVVPAILAALVSIRVPLYQPFRLIYIIPAFYILIALGISKLRFFKVLTSVVVLISLAGLIYYEVNPVFWREDWKGATNLVLNNSKSETRVLFDWPEPFPPYDWYGQNKDGIGLVSRFPATEDEVNTNLSKVSSNDIYLFEYLQPLSDPQRYTQSWLKDHGYTLEKIYNFNGVGFVDHYVKTI